MLIPDGLRATLRNPSDCSPFGSPNRRVSGFATLRPNCLAYGPETSDTRQPLYPIRLGKMRKQDQTAKWDWAVSMEHRKEDKI